MKRRELAFAAALTSVLALAAVGRNLSLSAETAKGATPAPAKIRVGTYDSRAIAVAWATSSYNPVAWKRADLEAAKKAGDVQKVKDLEAWGPAHQRLLHFQGFGRVPVDDLLVPVKAGVARIAREKGLAAIAMGYNQTAANVEVVDVTDALVGLYNPSEKTLQVVRSMRDVPPVGLLELADMKETD